MAEIKVQQYKIDAVASLKVAIEKSENYIFADYRGMTVAQIKELRDALREKGAEIHVVKNNYAKIAFKQLNYDKAVDCLIGPTAVAYCGPESGPVAKVMLKLGADMPISIKGGLFDGEFYDAKEVERFSKLPSRLELIQMLMGAMNAPVGNVAYALNGIVSKLVRTVEAVREKKSQES